MVFIYMCMCVCTCVRVFVCVCLSTYVCVRMSFHKQSLTHLSSLPPFSVMAKVDDEMLRHYCNEDIFLMEVQHRDAESYDLTLTELTQVDH